VGNGEAKMKEDAKKARLLAFFNSLSNSDKDLVLKVSEAIQEENQDTDEHRQNETAEQEKSE
jgi:hypothetical protein